MWVYLPYSRLPAAYQEVEYIESSGTQYINLWRYPTSNYCKVEANITPYSWSADWSVFRGMVNSSTSGYSLHTNKSTWYANLGSSNNINFNVAFNGWTNLDLNFTVDSWNYSLSLNGSTTTWTYNWSIVQSTRPFYLFAYNEVGSTTWYATMKVYSFKIYSDSSTLVRDLVPCYRKSDSVIWLYDLVNDTFYTNSGSGTFSKWSNVWELKNAYIGYAWTPWANTVAYYPLTSFTTTNDTKSIGTKYNLTNWGDVTFGTYQWVSCAYFNGTSNSKLYNTSVSFSAYPTQTVCFRFYINSTSTSVYQILYHIGTSSPNGKLGSWFKYNTWLSISSRDGGYESVKSWNITWAWHLLTNVTSWSSSIQYLDGQLYQTFTNSLSGTQNQLYIGSSQSGTSERLTGYESEFIVEDTAWTATQITEYYNLTKWNYWIS